MKKLYALISVILIFISLCSCKDKGNGFDPLPEEMENPPVKVTASNDFEVPLPAEFTFDYNMEEYITLPDYKSADFKFNHLPTDNASIDKDIEYLKLNSASTKVTQVNRESAEGDMVIFDYTSVFESNEEPALSGNSISLVLGKDMFAPGFDDYLEGMKNGQSKIFNYTFPKSWTTDLSVAGKTLSFTVNVKYVNEILLTDLETVINEQNVKDETELRNLLAEQREETNRYNFFEEIIKQSTVVSYPEKEYAYCESIFEADVEARAKMQGITKEHIIVSEYNNSLESYEAAKKVYAEDKCKRAMVTYYLQDIYGFELTKEEYNLCVEEYFETNGGEMALNSVNEVHSNMGTSLANSLFADLAAQAAYNEKAR